MFSYNAVINQDTDGRFVIIRQWLICYQKL